MSFNQPNQKKIVTKISAAIVLAAVLFPAGYSFAQTSTSTDIITPAITATTTSQAETASSSPVTDPIYNKKLEDVLNETITPVAPKDRTPATQPKATTTPATITPVPKNPPASGNGSEKSSKPAAPAVTHTPSTDSKTTPPATLVENSIAPTQANEFLPNNYYSPLDSLSPTITYTLCALAMLLGTSGAFLILREPQAEIAWTPGLATQEPLLKP
jgi:hypothetical protein